MKKALFSVLIVLVLLLNCGTVFAQGRGRQADANEPAWQAEARRMRDREPQREREMRRKERQKTHEIRLREREKTRRARDVGQPAGKLGKGKEHQQQLEALQTRMAHEKAKHLRRVARLNRIRGLAAEEDTTKTAIRVDRLLQLEQRRYDHKRQLMDMQRRKIMRIQGRRERVPPPGEKSLREKTRKAVERRARRGRGKGEGKSRKKDAGKKGGE